jgi:hypothetical protein
LKKERPLKLFFSLKLCGVLPLIESLAALALDHLLIVLLLCSPFLPSGFNDLSTGDLSSRFGPFSFLFHMVDSELLVLDRFLFNFYD